MLFTGKDLMLKLGFVVESPGIYITEEIFHCLVYKIISTVNSCSVAFMAINMLIRAFAMFLGALITRHYRFYTSCC